MSKRQIQDFDWLIIFHASLYFLILPGDKVNQNNYWVICSGSNLLVVINTNVLDHMSKVASVTVLSVRGE